MSAFGRKRTLEPRRKPSKELYTYFFGRKAQLRVSCSMNFNKAIAEVRIRLASARATRDGYRATVRHEKYIAACLLVESLETELELRKQDLRLFVR